MPVSFRGFIRSALVGVLFVGTVVAQDADSPLPTGTELLRAADETLRNAKGLSFTIHREGSGAQATREPSTTARVVLWRHDEADRAGLADRAEKPQWSVAAFGHIASPDGQGEPAPFAFMLDPIHARYADRAKLARVEADASFAGNLLTDSGAWTALQWLSEWETLVGRPIVDGTPRVPPRFDGHVLVGKDATRAVYVDLTEFPGTSAFGAWWYLGVADGLPRRFELVYYDVRAEGNQSVGDGISRLTISDIRAFDSAKELPQALRHAAALLDQTHWLDAGDPTLAESLDEAAPFVLPEPKGYRTLAYEPPRAARTARAPQAPQAPPLNIPAPDFTLKDPMGNEHTLSDYRGKVVILDFWATWCQPCLMVMPDLNAVHQQYKDQGVVVIGINAWENGDPAGLMKARGWDYLLLLQGDRVAADYQVTGIPTMVVIDPSGMIVQRKVGASANVAEQLVAAIEAARP